MNSIKHFSLRNLLWKAWLIAGLLSVLGVTVALAASGALDTSFNDTGKLIMSFVPGQSSQVRGISVAMDGTIAVIGTNQVSTTNSNIAIARLTKKGVLDTTFNGTGLKSVDLGGVDQGMAGFIAASTSKIVVAGNKCSTDGLTCDVAVLRFNPSGTYDTRWNDTGKRIDDFGGGDNRATAIAVQPDGYAVVAGYMFSSASHTYDFSVFRYDNRGELDTNFNGSGKKAIAFGATSNDQAFAVAIQSDGKILVAGKTCDASFLNCNFAIARLRANGSLDTTFSGDGKRGTDFGGQDYATGIAIQANGRIVVVGGSEGATSNRFALARYKSDGSFDSSFAGTGAKLLDFSGTGESLGAAVAIVPSTQKIVVCGQTLDNVGVARLTPTGYLDTAFHGTGKTTVNFGGTDFCNSLVIQPTDYRYLVAGWSHAGTTDYWALARFLP